MLHMKNNFQSPKNINFGYNIYFDTGASKKGGSIEGEIRSSQTDKLITKFPADGKGVVCPKGIKNSAEYVKNIAKHFETAIKSSIDKIKNLKGDDQKLEAIVGFVPGQTRQKSNRKGFIAPILANILDLKNNSLKNVDYSLITDFLKSKNIAIKENVSSIQVNDLMGATLGIAKQNKELLKPGFMGAVFMTGGGFGVAYMEVTDVDGKQYLTVKASESGHNKSLNSDNNYEKTGASVPAMIDNFCEKAGIDSQAAEVFKAIGDARIVSNFEIKLKNDPRNQQLAKKLSNMENIQVTEKNNDYTIKIINKSNLRAAKAFAVKAYTDDLATMAHLKINEGYNTVFLAGPLATKNANPALNNKLADVIEQKARKLSDAAGNNLADMYDFKVVIEDKVQENTIGSKLLSKGQFQGNRGNYFMIPLSEV